MYLLWFFGVCDGGSGHRVMWMIHMTRKGKITRGRTHSTYLIGGSQTVQHCQQFVYVLRALLTNSPDSCPPESLFSIFNVTYNDDQKRSHVDYIKLSMQSQFNKRAM
jgi:hypothetical protein